MKNVEVVTKADDLIKIKTVLVSCFDKKGLVTNEGMGENFPECGILGKIVQYSPDARFIATGKTFEVIKRAGLNVVDISEYTGFPEMKSGMVKTLHPSIHGGILGNKYTKSDQKYMSDFNILPIDAIIVNFYEFREAIDNNESLEMVRQTIDIGGQHYVMQPEKRSLIRF